MTDYLPSTLLIAIFNLFLVFLLSGICLFVFIAIPSHVLNCSIYSTHAFLLQLTLLLLPLVKRLLKYVYIPIELSQRELMPALFYASLFADETTTVILVNNWYFTQLLQVKALPPGLVIDKDLSHRGYFQRFKSAKEQGFVIASKIIEDLDIRQDWHSSLYSDARSVDVLISI